MAVKYTVRNDYVLIRVVTLPKNKAGIHIPQQSEEGKRHYVEEVGPKVEGLKKGDRVLVVADNFGYLPGTRELMVVQESSVVLVINDTEE